MPRTWPLIALALVATSVPATAARAHGVLAAHPILALTDVSAAPAAECSQTVFGFTADAAKVRPYVPDAFVFSRDVAGKAQLGYRVFSCPALRVDGVNHGRVTWSELGVRLLPPQDLPEFHADTHVDGHDYYMLAFHTDDPGLAGRLREVGIVPPADPRTLVESLTYDAPTPTVEPIGATPSVKAGETGPQGEYQARFDGFAGIVRAVGQANGTVQPYTNVREWLVRPGDCRILHLFERKTKANVAYGSSSLTVGPDTPIGRITGATELTSLTDPWVVFDTEITVELLDTPASPLTDMAAGVLGPRGGRACVPSGSREAQAGPATGCARRARLAVAPRRAVVGRALRLRFRARGCAGTIRFGGSTLRPDRSGRASIFKRFRRPGRHVARLVRGARTLDTAVVMVRARRPRS